MFNVFYTLIAKVNNKKSTKNQGQLKIRLSNLSPRKGVINVSIINEEYAQYDNPFKQEIFPFNFIVNDEVIVDRLPYGTYAVRVFHDENCNGEIDLTSFGYHKESIGYSGHNNGSGNPPNFQAGKFVFSPDNDSISVTLSK